MMAPEARFWPTLYVVVAQSDCSFLVLDRGFFFRDGTGARLRGAGGAERLRL